jgi:hypothetical protein
MKRPDTDKLITETPGQYLANLFSDLHTGLFVNVGASSESDGMKGRIFALDENMAAKVDEFCAENSGANLYYGVNPCRNRPKKGKASKADVMREIHFVQCDIDPPADIDDLDAWKMTQIEAIKGAAPTALVDSGNGLQAIWRLSCATDHGGAESINRALCKRLGGDNAATDVSRLLRLPFTTNYPNESKRKKGRVEVPTTLVWFELQKTDPEDLGPDRIDELKVSEFIRYTIRTGTRHPDDTRDPYPSASEARCAVIAALLGAKYSDEDIVEIVSESPVRGDKKHNDGWIEKEIERIKQDLIPQHIQFFIDAGWSQALLRGSFRLIRSEWNPAMKRNMLRVVQKQDFASIYADKYDEIENARIDHVKEFLKSKSVTRYMDIVVEPTKPGHYRNKKGEPIYNLWQGYSVEPMECDGKAISLIKEHIFKVIADSDQDIADYFWKWFCFAVQYPSELAKVALVIKGARGTGKSVFVRIFGRLFGQHFLHMTSSDSLTAGFNAEQRDVILLLADEAFWVADKKAANRLKGLITEPVRDITYKGVDKFYDRNMLKVVFVSNEDWVAPAGEQERRYCVTEVSPIHQNDDEYFAPLFALAEGRDEAGLAELLDTMLAEDLSEFNIRKYPRTEALLEQQKHSLDEVSGWYLERLKLGNFHSWKDMHTWELCPGEWRWKSFLRYCSQNRVRYPPSQHSFGIRLAKLMPAIDENTGKKYKMTSRNLPLLSDNCETFLDASSTRKTDCYVYPPLDKCREYFCKIMGEGWTMADVTSEDEEVYDGREEF